MSADSQFKLYLVSYLICQSDDSRVQGYADLSARIINLQKRAIDSTDIPEEVENALDELVSKNDDKSINWSSLKDFIEGAHSSKWGSMYLSIDTTEVGPEKWTYVIKCEAPESVVESNLSDHLSKREFNQIDHHIEAVCRMDDDELFEEVYQST
jgi:hypothetical protein